MIQYRIELVDLMKRLNLPMAAAEIGVAEGRFSEDLLARGVYLYMVDAWKKLDQSGDGGFDQGWHDVNYATALMKTDRFKARRSVLRGMSDVMAAEVPDNSLGMIHLDGDHSYQGTMRDLIAWFPKLVQGGICSGHDFLVAQYGVMQAVKDFCKNKFEVYTMMENKPEDAGFLFIKK